eukprot:5681159-Prymnesium_polylepis.1
MEGLTFRKKKPTPGRRRQRVLEAAIQRKVHGAATASVGGVSRSEQCLVEEAHMATVDLHCPPTHFSFVAGEDGAHDRHVGRTVDEHTATDPRVAVPDDTVGENQARRMHANRARRVSSQLGPREADEAADNQERSLRTRTVWYWVRSLDCAIDETQLAAFDPQATYETQVAQMYRGCAVPERKQRLPRSSTHPRATSTFDSHLRRASTM